MPRPGPRPYECIRRAWHSDSHEALRGSLTQEIFRVVTEVHASEIRQKKEWQEKLPIVVLKAEEILYSKARTQEEYLDVETLKSRLEDAVNTMIRRTDDSSMKKDGPYMEPCVEAALSLGCLPKSNPRGYRPSAIARQTTTKKTSSSVSNVIYKEACIQQNPAVPYLQNHRTSVCQQPVICTWTKANQKMPEPVQIFSHLSPNGNYSSIIQQQQQQQHSTVQEDCNGWKQSPYGVSNGQCSMTIPSNTSGLVRNCKSSLDMTINNSQKQHQETNNTMFLDRRVDPRNTVCSVTNTTNPYFQVSSSIYSPNMNMRRTGNRVVEMEIDELQLSLGPPTKSTCASLKNSDVGSSESCSTPSFAERPRLVTTANEFTEITVDSARKRKDILQEKWYDINKRQREFS